MGIKEEKEAADYIRNMWAEYAEMGRPKDKAREVEEKQRHELELVKLRTEVETLRGVLAGPGVPVMSNRGATVETPPAVRNEAPAPTFKVVVDAFLEGYQQDKKGAMFQKHQAVIPMLLEVVGDKPITELKQADINAFFALLGNLPPRWSDECRRRNISVRELAALEHKKALGPKTFQDTYIACVRAFLKAAKKDWMDQGFPTTLTTDGIEYKGSREEGENKQRAFQPKELVRLFNGPEMQAFANDPDQAHCYWLPHIGLFTGARVNEICQLNPQTDILEDDETGIHYFWITEETEGDERIDKSTKNKVSRRKVPIHSTLIELGFLRYVERVQKAGAKLLFPQWKPSRGKASGEAEKWFRNLIRDTGLRDETPGERLVGMHAFRHTLLNRAMNANPPLDATSITGHAGEESSIVRGYQGDLSLENKQRILDAITFGVAFIRPQEPGAA